MIRFQQEPKIQNYPKIGNLFLKSLGIEAKKPGIRKKMVTKTTSMSVATKEGVLVITEKFLKITKLSLQFVNVQKLFMRSYFLSLNRQ